MDKTTIGDRMKRYEAATETHIIQNLPVIIRLDGRSFSKFTKGMKKPFDEKFHQSMVEVTKYLVDKTNAKIGYTQSDEITIILHNENVNNSEILFNGRVQKMASNFASLASVKFILEMQKHFPEKVEGYDLPSFDARVFAVPNKTEAANNLVWRCQDASKNSISMVAQHYFSHKSLQGLNGKEMQYKLLTEKDINWNDLPSWQKQGTFVRKEKTLVKLEEEKLELIPLDKRPEDGMVVRNKMVEINMPNFLKVLNRNEVIFDYSEPKLD